MLRFCADNFAHRKRGFTLIELLTALLILSLLALLSYRGLAAVLDTRERVNQETLKWRHLAAFFARFERDLRLAAPRPVRLGPGLPDRAPAWRGEAGARGGSRLEFSRFASYEGVDSAQRLAYTLNENQEIELWLWTSLDIAPESLPARYPVLAGVGKFDLQYLNSNLAWVNLWPISGPDSQLPLAVQMRIVLTSGEEITRVFDMGT